MEAEDFLQFQQSQVQNRARQQEVEALQSQQQVPQQHRGLQMGGQSGGLQHLAETPQTQQRSQQHQGLGLQVGAQQLPQTHLQGSQQAPLHNLQPGSQQLHQVPHLGQQPRGQGHAQTPKQPPGFDLADAPPDLMSQSWEMAKWLTDSGLSKKEATEKSMAWLRKQTMQRSRQQQQPGQPGLAPEVVQLLQGQDSVNRVLAENITRNSESTLDPLAHT